MPLSKRCFDLLLTSAGFIGVLPLLLFLALAVRWTLGAPVFFVQERPGFGGRPFRMFKFRTMTDERDAEGRLLPDEKRLTRLGRMLRSTSLDELPELFNVLKGEMSLVGPRPLLMRYLDRYTPEQSRRHGMPPGVTGWAQVNGRNAISWEEKFELDVWYVDHWSLGLDVRILGMTLLKVLKREGISQEGQATMEEFIGQPAKEQCFPQRIHSMVAMPGGHGCQTGSRKSL
jgi:lipopolysaccharide/colanic/teichoic acid biosynthesis glycosyltransferase